MQLTPFVLSLALCGVAPLAAQAALPAPSLAVDVFATVVKFRVSGPQRPFLGAVLLSFRDTQSVQFPGLPPLLDDFAVAGVGAATVEYNVGLPTGWLPRGVKVYAQGLVAEGSAIAASPAAGLLLKQG